MADEQPADLARELRLIRQTLLGLLGVVAVGVSYQLVDAMRWQSATTQELHGIQAELRLLREEHSRHRPTSSPPVVIPTKPPGGDPKDKW